MTILVFGQTGQVAKELAQYADVTTLGRDVADLTDPDACSAAIADRNVAAVINAAAYTAVDKAETEGLKDIRGDRKDNTAGILNWGIEHEYTVVLQYMFHSYMTGNAEAKRQLEDQAINEMQHLGWLAEEMVDGGGNPRIEHIEVDRSTRTADMLKADIKIEKDVAAEYDRAAGEVEDPDLKNLPLRPSSPFLLCLLREGGRNVQTF